MMLLTRRWRAFRRAPIAAAMVAAAGCGGSQPINVAAQPRIAPDQLVEFEYRDSTVQLDSVRFGRDSISGIPWHDARHCCTRMSYPVAEISRPRIHTFPALSAILGGAFALLLIFAIELAVHLSGD